MTIAASSLINKATLPPNPSLLWTPAVLFAADWSNGIKIHQSFLTDITKSVDDTEQRRGLILAPARIIEADLLIHGPEMIGYFRAFLLRAAVSRFLFPLYNDETFVTAAPFPSQIMCDTTDKRFFVGGYVAVVGYDLDLNVKSLTVAKILAVAVDSITTTVGTSFDATYFGYSVFPLIEAELLLEQSAVSANDSILQASLTISESRGSFSLDTYQAIGTNPGGFTYTGYPVLTLEPDMDQNTVGMIQSGEYTDNGRGRTLQIYGTQARWNYTLRYIQATRAQSVALIKWFEAMGGRLKPFFILSPMTDWQAISFTAASVVVKSSLLTIDWTFYKYIGVRHVNGSIQVRLINSVVQTGLNWEVFVDAWTVQPTLPTLDRLSIAHLVRFDTDEMVEEWVTDGVMVSSLKLIEVMNEADVTITDIKDFTGGY